MIPEQAIIRIQNELDKYNAPMAKEIDVIKTAIAKLTMIQSIIKVEPETIEEKVTSQDIEQGKRRTSK